MMKKVEDESLYWIENFNLRLAVVNVCPVYVSSEFLLSTHLSTSEGWTAELTVVLWFAIPTTGFEPTQADLTRFETLCLNHSATRPPDDFYHCDYDAYSSILVQVFKFFW